MKYVRWTLIAGLSMMIGWVVVTTYQSNDLNVAIEQEILQDRVGNTNPTNATIEDIIEDMIASEQEKVLTADTEIVGVEEIIVAEDLEVLEDSNVGNGEEVGETIIDITQNLGTEEISHPVDEATQKEIVLLIEKNREEGADIDLVNVGSTLIYAQVNDIVMDPRSYIGKTINMEGYLQIWDIGEEQPMYALIIPDAIGCCAQGFEIQFPGDGVATLEMSQKMDLLVEGEFKQSIYNGLPYYYIEIQQIEEI